MDREVRGSELLDEQLWLEKEARKKFPWDPSECTLYMDIPPRQLLFACLTCHPTNAICYACGLRCHADHEIVELYTKRNIRCDCGSTRIASNSNSCALRRTRDDPPSNPGIEYGHNFEGRFCECEERVSDESYGHAAMFQCLVGTRCQEDWFHARCIVNVNRDEEVSRQEAVEYESEESGDDLDAVFPEIPSEFGALICPSCAQDVPQIINSSAVLAEFNKYYFLKEDYGMILAKELPHLLHEFPFLNGKEASYTPDVDADDATLLEAGEAALSRLPHEAVVNGLEKFNSMKDSLMLYLQHVGRDGHAITKEDIQQFFNKD